MFNEYNSSQLCINKKENNIIIKPLTHHQALDPSKSQFFRVPFGRLIEAIYVGVPFRLSGAQISAKTAGSVWEDQEEDSFPFLRSWLGFCLDNSNILTIFKTEPQYVRLRQHREKEHASKDDKMFCYHRYR